MFAGVAATHIGICVAVKVAIVVAVVVAEVGRDDRRKVWVCGLQGRDDVGRVRVVDGLQLRRRAQIFRACFLDVLSRRFGCERRGRWGRRGDSR